ncbi:hypothetical protein A9K55_000745 [Cordyceps militaris]|uniref:Uncharacterized protein n=1 Tax=Cordyceps militaris TaxID=73501 RepID=A0A2H4STI0_CORMI|nr:hypothetical protein A9K55_000745 [Cordyceps militaris]
MAVRILVKCSSQTIPGTALDRRTTIANIACRHRLGRDFDERHDGLRSAGHHVLDHSRCYFLIDIGPRASQDPEVCYFRWNGEVLCEQRVTPPLIWHLTNIYPFNPDPADIKSFSDEEYRATYGEEAFAKLVMGRIKVKRKMGRELSSEERRVLEQHPELADK